MLRILYPQEVSENEQLTFCFPEKRREKRPPLGTGSCRHHRHTSSAKCPLWLQEEKGVPTALEQQCRPPHQILHWTPLLSGAQGLRAPWRGQGAEASSIMDGP